MRYGFSKSTDPQHLLKRGCVKVFKSELDAVAAVRPGDELVTDEVTPLLESLADEHGDTYKILKAESIPAGLTWDEENSVNAMAERGFSKTEIAKALYLSDDAVSGASAYNADKIQKAYLRPAVSKQAPSDPFSEARAAVEDSRAAFADSVRTVIAKIQKADVRKAESDDAEVKLEKAAADIRKVEPRLTHEQALSKAYARFPELTAKLV